MNANEKIKAHREEAGLTLSEAAKQVGLSWNEYFDVELHDDEIFTVTELYQVKKICEVLKFDFFELFDIKCIFCEEGKQYLEDYSLLRNELIHKRRVELCLSGEEFGDRIGFYEVEVQNIESNPNHLETWRIDTIKDLSNVIDVPLQILLNVKCRKCGR